MNHGGREEAPDEATAVSAREQALLAYLRSMKQVVDAQRDVMMRYLGETAEAFDGLPGVHIPGAASTRGARSAALEPKGTAVPEMPPLISTSNNGNGRNGSSGTAADALGQLAADGGIRNGDRQSQGAAQGNGQGHGNEQGHELGEPIELGESGESGEPVKPVELDTLTAEPAEPDTVTADDAPDTSMAAQPPAVPPGPRRFVVETAMLAPALPVASAAGKSLALISDPWEGLDDLRGRLERSGAIVQVLPLHRGAPNVPVPDAVATLLAQVDGVVHLGAADQRAPVDARDVFAMLRPAIGGRATTLVTAAAPLIRGTPARVSGVPGLMRALARELPEHHVRAVELPPDQSPGVVARLLADEILDPAGPASVAYRDGTRLTRRVAKGTPLSSEAPALPFDGRSVILATGGARGITARVAVALARATGCRLELVGRSPMPADDEDPRIAQATDRRALRRVLVELGGPTRTSKEIESACDRILAAREIRATLAAIRAAGSPVTYHSADVRNRAAVERVLQDIRTRHGRLDAIVHGAGVRDDRPAEKKRDAIFDCVFATKVDAAYTLLGQLQHDVRLVVLFGSVSGVFGHQGHADDSSANDALDDLANRLDGFGGRRIISVDWGPWADTETTAPELEREYASRGIGLLDPDEGTRALLAEMATLPGEPAQVVVMRAEPEAFMDHRESTPVALPPPRVGSS